ncbi:hypothetical protein R6Q57_010687 [Mikania cordata]
MGMISLVRADLTEADIADSLLHHIVVPFDGPKQSSSPSRRRTLQRRRQVRLMMRRRTRLGNIDGEEEAEKMVRKHRRRGWSGRTFGGFAKNFWGFATSLNQALLLQTSLYLMENQNKALLLLVEIKQNIKDTEKLRPEELNQQNIEALVAESQLKMEILPVNDLDEALQNFINKDDRMAFYSCLQYNIEETSKSISRDPENMKIEVEDIIVKERVKGRSRSNEDQIFTSSASVYGEVGKTPSRRGGRGRGRGSNTLRQTTLDATFMSRRSERSASAGASASVQSIAAEEENLDFDSDDEPVQYGINELHDSLDDNESMQQGKGRKRGATRGRGRGLAAAKWGRKSDKHFILNSTNDDG